MFYFFIFYFFLIFGCARSSLQHGLFSSCGERGLRSGCSEQASHPGGLSPCRARARGHLGLWARWLRLPGATVVVRGLRCSKCGVFPDQGLNQCLLRWQADSLLLSRQRSPLGPLCVVLVHGTKARGSFLSSASASVFLKVLLYLTLVRPSP